MRRIILLAARNVATALSTPPHSGHVGSLKTVRIEPSIAGAGFGYDQKLTFGDTHAVGWGSPRQRPQTLFAAEMRHRMSSLQTTPESPVLLSEVQSGVLHLLGLISGVRRGGKGIPISSLGGGLRSLISCPPGANPSPPLIRSIFEMSHGLRILLAVEKSQAILCTVCWVRREYAECQPRTMERLQTVCR